MKELAKYDWKQLETEFILGDYKSVSEFLKTKGIKMSGSTKKQTKGWKEKKVQKEDKKSTKIIEKVTEKQIDDTVEKIFNVRELAELLGIKVQEAAEELNKRMKKSTTKTKTINYDYIMKKPSFEKIEEKEVFEEYITIIDKKGLKELTSALKDINDILYNKTNPGDNKESLADIIQAAYEKRKGENNADN